MRSHVYLIPLLLTIWQLIVTPDPVAGVDYLGGIPRFWVTPRSQLRCLWDRESQLARYHLRAKVLAGGTDLMVKMKGTGMAPDYVISLENLSDLDWGGDIFYI